MPECDHTCEVPSWRHVPDTCLRGLRGLRVHRQAGQCCFLTEDTTMNAGDPGDPGSLPGWIRWETLAIKHDLPWPSMTTGDGLWCLYHLQWWWCLYIYTTYIHLQWWGLVRLGEAWWYLMIFGDWVDQITPQVMAEVLPTVNGKLLMAAALERWTLWNLNAIVITSKNRRTWHDMWIYIYMTIVITIILIMKKKIIKYHQISLNHPNIINDKTCLFKPQPVGLGRWRLSVPLGRGSCECGHQGAAENRLNRRWTRNQRR